MSFLRPLKKIVLEKKKTEKDEKSPKQQENHFRNSQASKTYAFLAKTFSMVKDDKLDCSFPFFD